MVAMGHSKRREKIDRCMKNKPFLDKVPIFSIDPETDQIIVPVKLK